MDPHLKMSLLLSPSAQESDKFHCPFQSGLFAFFVPYLFIYYFLFAIFVIKCNDFPLKYYLQLIFTMPTIIIKFSLFFFYYLLFLNLIYQERRG